MSFELGQSVLINNKIGTIRFIGSTSFAGGEWIGVELNVPEGKNDGSVNDIRYFECKPNHGLFVKKAQIKLPPKTVSSSVSLEPSTTINKPIISSSSTGMSKLEALRMKRAALLESRGGGGSEIPSEPEVKKIKDTSSGKASPVIDASISSPTINKTITPVKVSETPLSSPSTNKTVTNEVKIKEATATPSPPIGIKKEDKTISIESPLIIQSPTSPASDSLSIDSPKRKLTDSLHTRRTSDGTSMTGSKSVAIVASLRDQLTDAQSDISTQATEVNRLKVALKEKEKIISDLELKLKGNESISLPPRPISPQSRSEVNVAELINKAIEDQKSKSLLEIEKVTLNYKLLLKEKEDNIVKISSDVAMLDAENRKLKHLMEETDESRSSDVSNQAKDKAALLKANRRVSELEASLQELNDMVEKLTMEKEIVQEEKEILEEKVVEMEIELEMVKTELETNQLQHEEQSVISTANEGINSNPQLKDLLDQNSKLREALSRLHVTHTNEKQEFTKRIRILEKDASNAIQFEGEIEKLQAANKKLSDTVNELKESLDDAHAYESIVEQLTERNLSLSERVADMTTTIEEFEELKDINEEMEDQHKLYEKELRKQLDDASINIQHLTHMNEGLNKIIVDKDATIKSFRSSASKLTAEKNALQIKVESLSRLDIESRDQMQESMSISLALKTKALTERKAILLKDMNTVELNTATSLSDFYRSFIPSNILGDDDDCFKTLLSLRLSMSKIEILLKLFDSKDDNDDGEEILVILNLRIKLLEARRDCECILYYLCSESINEEDYIDGSRRVNTYIRKIVTCLDDMVMNVMENKPMKSLDINSIILCLENLIPLKSNLKYLDSNKEIIVSGGSTDYDVSVISLEVIVQEGKESISNISSIVQVGEINIKDVEIVKGLIEKIVKNTIAALERLKILSNKVKINPYNDSEFDQINILFMNASKILSLSRQVYTYGHDIIQKIWTYMNESTETIILGDQIVNLVNGIVVTFDSSLVSVNNEMMELLNKTQFIVKDTSMPAFTPGDVLSDSGCAWRRRAVNKIEMTEKNSQLKPKLETLTSQLQFRNQEYALLERNNQEMNLKCESLELKLKESTKLADLYVTCNKELEILKQQEEKHTKEYEEAMEVLWADTENYKKEILTLKKQLKDPKNKTTTPASSPAAASAASNISMASKVSSPPIEVSALKASVILSQRLASQARRASIISSLQSLPPLPPVVTAYGALILDNPSKKHTEHSIDEVKLKREIATLSSSLNFTMANTKLVDLSAQEIQPKHQLKADYARILYFSDALSSLQTSVNKLTNNSKNHPSLFTGDVNKKLNSFSPNDLYSRISINPDYMTSNVTSGEEREIAKVSMSDEDIKQFHKSILIC